MNSEEEQLQVVIEEMDKRLEAARAKYRRALIEYRRLRGERRALATRLKRLSYRTYKQRSGMQDEWVIDSHDILPFIGQYILDHDGEYGTGGLRNLSDRSGVSTKTISDVIHGRRPYVTLSTADMLLTAVGESWQLAHIPRHKNNRGRPPKKPESHFYEE